MESEDEYNKENPIESFYLNPYYIQQNILDPFPLNYNYMNQTIFLDNFNNSLKSLNEEDNNSIQENNHIPYYTGNESNKENNIFVTDRRTDYETINNQNYINFSLKNKVKCDLDNSFKFFSSDDIRKICSTNKEFSDIQFENNKYIDILECKLCGKKRIRDNVENNYNDLKENKKKRGRKCKENIEKEEHNKYSSDNIIKKIKGYLFAYLVNFINNILDKKNDDKDKIYKVNYKFIDQLKKRIDLELLEKSLKELLSLDITSKLKTIAKDANKTLIKNIENKKVFVEDYDTIMFVLNMKFKDWISLFTCKKNIDEILKEKSINSQKKISKKKIEESLIKANKLLNQILKKNDQEYCSTFIFHLYNYEMWFARKSERNAKI